MIGFREGQTVRVRGTRSVVVRVAGSTVDPDVARLDVRVLTGEWPGHTFSVIVPIERVEAEAAAPLSLERLTTYRLWERFHDAYRFELTPAPNALAAKPQARITIEEYQRVPAQRALALPRPRLLIADDVGLGKTIEAGLVYLELAARHRARRVLVVAPASICRQWRDELLEKFGIEFEVFTRDRIEEVRRTSDIGANPFTLRPRIIISLDLAKMEGTFAELRASTWDLAIVDEAHHVALDEDADKTQNRRFAEWLQGATHGLLLLSATPHDGNDATFASLLELLERRIVPPGAPLQRTAIEPFVVRRLKRDIYKADGRTPRFVARESVVGLAVTLSHVERVLHDEVMAAIRELRETARGAKGEERVRVDFLATIVRKRLASSRAALARTVENRRDSVDAALETIRVRRDLLRRARSGEPLTSEEQAQLELDLHAASIEAARRRIGRASRRSEAERDLFDGLVASIADLAGEPESKIEVLARHLAAVHAEDPDENVLVFSEYRDTVEDIGRQLRDRFGSNVLVLHGESEDRTELLTRFSTSGGLILVATDVASEGLNLQARCRTIVHYDLPWNPNRLEQRNGRIDRYGQRRAPRIAYLYAADTYDGELLNILVRKIERQIAALGSVGDVLGALQPRRLDDLFGRTEDRMTPTLRVESERRVDALLTDAVAPRALATLATPTLRINVVERPALGSFVAGAIRQCGGDAQLCDGRLTIVKLPLGWRPDGIESRYALEAGATGPMLSEQSSLVRAAVNALRELRYDRKVDPRVAAVVNTAVDAPTLVGTFVVGVRARDGGLVEELVAYGGTQAGDVFPAEQLIAASNAPEPSDLADRARDAFAGWWKEALDRLRNSALAKAEALRESISRERSEQARRAKQQLGDWFAAECRVARDAAGVGGLGLFAEEPLVVRRRIAALETEHARQREALEAYQDVSVVEPDSLGALLVMPA